MKSTSVSIPLTAALPCAGVQTSEFEPTGSDQGENLNGFLYLSRAVSGRAVDLCHLNVVTHP